MNRRASAIAVGVVWGISIVLGFGYIPIGFTTYIMKSLGLDTSQTINIDVPIEHNVNLKNHHGLTTNQEESSISELFHEIINGAVFSGSGDEAFDFDEYFPDLDTSNYTGNEFDFPNYDDMGTSEIHCILPENIDSLLSDVMFSVHNNSMAVFKDAKGVFKKIECYPGISNWCFSYMVCSNFVLTSLIKILLNIFREVDIGKNFLSFFFPL